MLPCCIVFLFSSVHREGFTRCFTIQVLPIHDAIDVEARFIGHRPSELEETARFGTFRPSTDRIGSKDRIGPSVNHCESYC